MLPKNVTFVGEDQALFHDRRTGIPTGLSIDDVPAKPDQLSPSTNVTSSISGQKDEEKLFKSQEKEEEEPFKSPGIWRIVGIVSELMDSGLEMTINWLESRAIYYHYLLEKLEQLATQQESPQQPLASPSDDIQLISVSTRDDKDDRDKDDASIKSFSADEVDHDHVELYSKERVYETWRRISQRPLELLQALYQATLANTEYICYLLIVINVMVNGSILSLVYAALMFLWGLMSIPWPTKRFWLTLTFYTMFVILLKYGFQFQEIEWDGSPDAGIYWPHILGIEKRHKFYENVVWDILLLIFLFVHRGLLHVSNNRTYLSVCLFELVLKFVYSSVRKLGVGIFQDTFLLDHSKTLMDLALVCRSYLPNY